MHKNCNIIPLIFVTISFALANCSPTKDEIHLTPTSYSPSKVETVRQAEQRWLDAGVIKYQMTMTISSSWLLEEYTVEVDQENVKLVRFDCTPGWLGEDFMCDRSEEHISQLDTVIELFGLAESWAAENNGMNLQIRFNVIYGYPTFLAHDDPEMFDEEETINVSVKVLK